jgi:hypothetical protein
MLRTSTLLAVVTGFGLAGAGCIAEEGDDTVDDENIDTVEQAIAGCSKLVCGENSPWLNTFFHDLNENGTANAEGVKLLGIWFPLGAGFQKYDKVWVDGDQLKAQLGATVKSGAGVKNAVLRALNVNTGELFFLRIHNVVTTNLYPVGSGTTWAYDMRVTVFGSDQHERTLCTKAGQLHGEEDTLFQNKFTAVLFDGERYLAEPKLVGGPAADWFNIGCAGATLQKMHLTHRSKVSGTGLYATTVGERQAMLKMLTADYCKTGKAFTLGGVDLGWTDDDGSLPYVYPTATLTLDGRWGSAGPLCIQTPRLTGSTDPLYATLFGGDIETAIDTECPLTRPPKCSDLGQSLDPTKLYGAHLVSATPP